MTIIVVGLNHRTAPIELREKLALAGCALPMALEELGGYREPLDIEDLTTPYPVQEAVILSTCNRLEVYAVVRDHDTGWHQIETFIGGLQNIPVSDLRPHLYQLKGADAVRHLMRVSCGLDSMILGESQILGQVAQAFREAQSVGLTGPVLSHLFSHGIHAGKRAHTDTAIGSYATSISHAGVRMVLEKVSDIQSPNILIVGAGEMAVLAAKSMQRPGINLALINRTYSRAESLASELGGEPMSWPQLGEALIWADAVITATGAPHTVIYANDVARELPKREQRPLLFVDIAAPRDVETIVGELDGVQRFDIDDLQSIVDTNTAQRKAAIPAVERIISHQLHVFLGWYHSRSVTPVIQNLRQWANEVAQMEVDQALNKLQDADEHTAQIINRLAHRIVNKLLHEPTVRLRGQASEGNGHAYAHALTELFGLHPAVQDHEQALNPNGNDNIADDPHGLERATPTEKYQSL